MCGICGILTSGRQVGEEDRTIVWKMNGKLAHRGPDAHDVLLFQNVALGFSRLSIIGLDNGMQPIFNEDGSIVLVCNGEIFNYIELRHFLKGKGHRFRTDSDVEVIIHLYEDYGREFLNRLNGQFAFALYDGRTRTLFCARDQLGIVPFYYALIGDTFIFGSEIKAIIEHPRVPRQVDLVGLDQVLTFAGLISPRTMFTNIHSLQNGHFLSVVDGRVTCTEYWDLQFPDERPAPDPGREQEYVDGLEQLFETAVALRLRADVPSGIYLSGGLDSSMIAMKVHRLSAGTGKDAFSIDFVDSQHSESRYQRLIADRSNSSLHQKTFFYQDIAARLPQSIYHSECPIKETYNTASLSLSEAVRARGIKVVLSGEGADEFFAGYVGYRFDKIRAMNGSSHPPAERAIRERLWGDSSFYYECNFTDLEKIKRALYAPEIAAEFEAINCLDRPVINRDRLQHLNLVDKRTYIDYKIRLVDHLVSDHGDRMALANSVEARYPFLDKELVEYSARLPPDLKLKDFTEKYILRKMARRFVPQTITDREKFHFIAPGSPYLLRNNVDYVHDILSERRIRDQGYFNPREIDRLRKCYGSEGFTINAPYESDLLITVITFGILLETFFDQ